jgi:hypothetical protein
MVDYDNSRDPLRPSRAGIDEEDTGTLGLEDSDDRTDVTDDPLVAADYAEPYIAPTDPPVVPGGRDTIEVAQGFAGTSEGYEERAGTPGDDEITERVRDLLGSDAATSTLNLHVYTVDGVVYLRGRVQSLDDTDLAAEIATRIPGVVDVVDEMTVEA